ncbi:hypothetical protein ACFLQN_01660 [Candidatus Aenigmatarchaeota archaeon]
MRLVKKYSLQNDITDNAFYIFSKLVKKLSFLEFFDLLEIEISTDFVSEIKGRNAKIKLDYNNIFIRNKDEKMVRYFILKRLFSLLIQKKLGRDVPKTIRDILTNREIIKYGFSDEVSYHFFMYLSNTERKITNKNDFLFINLPWIIFYPVDEHGHSFFKKNIKKFEFSDSMKEKTKKLFNSAKKDLWIDKNLNNTIKHFDEFAKK